jgi:hypothetical protein
MFGAAQAIVCEEQYPSHSLTATPPPPAIEASVAAHVDTIAKTGIVALVNRFMENSRNVGRSLRGR